MSERDHFVDNIVQRVDELERKVEALTRNVTYVDTVTAGSNTEVQIPMGHLNGSTASYSYWDTGVLRIVIDTARYPAGAVAYFEAVIKSSDASYTTSCELYNITDGADVSGSEVAATSVDWVRKRSGPFSLASGEKVYDARYHSNGGTAYLWEARLIIHW